MLPNRTTATFLVTLTLAAAILAWVIVRVEDRSGEGREAVGWQASDSPPDHSEPVDPWLMPADAWTEAALPVAVEIGPAIQQGNHVHAVADGIVMFSGIRAGTRAVILGHRNAAGVRFESIYQPLERIACRPGQLLGRGMRIGEIGSLPLEPVLRNAPVDLEEVAFGKSQLAITLEQPDGQGWMNLEIGNAEKILELED